MPRTPMVPRPMGASLRLIPQNGLAGAGHHDDLLALGHALHGDELVAVLQVDGDEAVAARAVVLIHGGLLHVTLSRGEHEELLGREVLRGDNGRDGLALLQRQQVHDGRAAGMTAGLGDLVHLQAGRPCPWWRRTACRSAWKPQTGAPRSRRPSSSRLACPWPPRFCWR